MSIAIIIPARYGSSRFPGKPLAEIGGKAMLEHVYARAVEASAEFGNCQIWVATEDTRIRDFCKAKDLPVVMTPEDCKTGSDRVHVAAEKVAPQAEFIVNLQGDVPFVPPHFIKALLEAYRIDPGSDIYTPVTQLSWAELDSLRAHKRETPFSGTTAVIGTQRQAFWFSKNIIPAIRRESDLRDISDISPVHRHIGLYGYTKKALARFITLEEGVYEKLEGLEQLRALENGMKIKCVTVEYGNHPQMTGIDSPEDLARAQALFTQK